MTALVAGTVDPWYRRMRPPADLSTGVRRITAFVERSAAPWQRREPPTGFLTVIMALADPVGVGTGDAAMRPLHAFATGAWAGPGTGPGPGSGQLITQCGPVNIGIEMQVRPWMARPVFGVSAAEMMANIVDLGGHAALPWLVADCYGGLQDWPAVIQAGFGWLRDRVAMPAAAPRRDMIAAWQRLEVSGGTLPIAALAAGTGWSHRHFKALFQAEMGLSPKAAARLLRFDRARTLIEGAPEASLAAIAAACGYSDQSHLTREVRAFAAASPGALRRESGDHRAWFVPEDRLQAD